MVGRKEKGEFWERGLDRLEGEMWGSEIKVVIIGGMMRDVDVGVFGGNGRVRVKEKGGIMIEWGRRVLEE